VARESAELIITDDNFASIVAGVEEGSVAYRYVRRVIFLLVSTEQQRSRCLPSRYWLVCHYPCWRSYYCGSTS
jgi:hypothetical protein